MKKIIVSIVIAFAFVLSLAACASTAPTSSAADVKIPNPIASVGSAKDFEKLGFSIDAPKAAEDISYSIIADKTAQVKFKSGENEITFRAAKETDWKTLCGVYEQFSADTESAELGGDKGKAELLTVEKSGGRLAYWSIGEVTYTVYTAQKMDTAGMSELILALRY